MMQEKDNHIKSQTIQNVETHTQVIFVNVYWVKVINAVHIAL